MSYGLSSHSHIQSIWLVATYNQASAYIIEQLFPWIRREWMMAMVAVGVMMKGMSLNMEITVTAVLSNLTSLNRVMSTYQCQSQSHKNGSTGEFTASLWWYRACCRPAVRFHSVLLPFQKLQADLTRLYDVHRNLHFEIHSLQNTNPAVCYHLKEAAAKVLDSINLLKSYRRQRHLALRGSFHNFFSHHGRMPTVSSFLGMARERAGIDIWSLTQYSLVWLQQMQNLDVTCSGWVVTFFLPGWEENGSSLSKSLEKLQLKPQIQHSDMVFPWHVPISLESICI